MNAAGETTITLDNESIHEDDESNVELEVELFQQLFQTDGINSNTLLFQITVLDQLVSFLQVVAEDDHSDQQDWIIMAGIFAELLALLKQRQLELIGTLRFHDAATYNATGSKFVTTEHARTFLLGKPNLRRRCFAIFTSS